MSIAKSLITALVARDTCNYKQAQSGDGCWSLAEQCGISQDDLAKYNPPPFSCDTIIVGDYVCCSPGTLPDFSPKPQDNGDCATYTVKSGDTCSSIAAANQIKDWHLLEDVNKQTWGWAGCSFIQIGQNICLSSGNPPFPAPVENTVCGPQVPGTQKPDGWWPPYWAVLNPCPLNACCDIWGQCGTSADFCTATPADSGAPGTAKPGTNGCISNCGTKITNNDKLPETIKRIGYFEAWNADRPCLHMDVSILSNSKQYTHVHFAFGNLSNDWTPDVRGAQDQFDKFKALQGIKRILSFGGWTFSNDLSTYSVFRTGVQPQNRDAFADRVVNFIHSNNLDGVDFDWEYPGAPDIKGPPPDSLDSGANYLEFLKLVRARLDSSKSLSIAAPASYWYLKAFPIKEIAVVVDYIIYMTYDLHGQWDYDNKWANPGCPNGNCLRHQTNDTETSDALAMITKAGVPAAKVVVGMPMYGRSFKMTQPGCVFPPCTFVGPESGAAKGRCTQTAGYISNAEIFEIINEAHESGKQIIEYYDQGDILVYNDTEWVSYMKPSTYRSRQLLLDAYGFAGTSDWAIDLNGTYSLDSSLGGDDSDEDDVDVDYEPCEYRMNFDNLESLEAIAPAIRTDCMAGYTLRTLDTMMDRAYNNYTDVNNGYDEMFDFYVKYMKKLVPSILSDGFMFNLSISKENTGLEAVGFGMQYFDCVGGQNGDDHFPCTDLKQNKHQEDLERLYPVTLTLNNKDGYEKALADAGIDPAWTTFGDYEQLRDVVFPRASRTFHYRFKNFPIAKPDMVLPNPKDVITKGLTHIPDIQLDMKATLLDIYMAQWLDGSVQDPGQVYSIPVFTLMQGIEGMAQAKELGKKEKEKEEKEEEERKKNIILLVFTVILLFVPVVGEELAAAAGMVTLARGIAIAGELGNAAMGVYDTVDHPKDAFVNVLGMLVGVGAIAKASRDGKGISDIAKIRSTMNAKSVGSLGKIFSDQDTKLQNIAKVCKWA